MQRRTIRFCLRVLSWVAVIGGGCSGDESSQEPILTSEPTANWRAMAEAPEEGSASAANPATAGASRPATAPGAGMALTAPGAGAIGHSPMGAPNGAAGGTADAGSAVTATPVDAGSDAAAADGDCDRECLLDFMQMYLDALVAHDPSTIPAADSLKYTENGLPAQLGDATWKTFEEPIAGSRLDFADPVQMNVGTQLAYREGGTLVRFGLRLKVQSRQITEIESMTARMGDHFAWSEGNLEPQPIFFEVPTNPNSREELLEITNFYVDYLEGTKRGAELPFAEDCARHENGLALAQGRASFERQSWNFTVEPRRILIVDELMGVTWGNLPFDGVGRPETLVVGEAFKIMDGEFKMIQAVLRYQTNDEWD